MKEARRQGLHPDSEKKLLGGGICFDYKKICSVRAAAPLSLREAQSMRSVRRYLKTDSLPAMTGNLMTTQ